MSIQAEVRDISKSGGVFADSSLDKRVASYDDLRGGAVATQYTVADLAFSDIDHREENGERDQSVERDSSLPDVAQIRIAKNRFGNPNHRSDMTPSAKVHSTWHWLATTILKGDQKAANLLTEFAMEGWKAARETADRVAGQKFQDPARRQVRGAGASMDFMVVASTEQEARIYRAWIDYAMSKVSDGNQIGDDRPTRFSAKAMPETSELMAIVKETRPGLERLPGMKDKDKLSYAVLAAPGAEQFAADFVKAMPGAAKDPLAPKAMLGAGRRLDALVAGDPALAGKTFALDIQGRDNFVNNRTAEAADRVVAFLSKDEDKNGAVMEAVARAHQRGTLAAAFDGEGKRLSITKLGERASAEFPPFVIQERNSQIDRFKSVAASSAEGRLFFQQLPGATRDVINTLSGSAKSVGDILTMAVSEEGKAVLSKEYGIPSKTIAAIGDAKAIRTAANAYDKIIADCFASGVQVVGPDKFPGRLSQDPQAPAVLFVKGDAAKLAEGKPSVLLAGDNDAPAWMADGISSLAKEVSALGHPVSLIENRGFEPGQVDPAAVKALWLTTGHDHADVTMKALKWAGKDEGGLADIDAKGPKTDWRIKETVEGAKHVLRLTEVGASGQAKLRAEVEVKAVPSNLKVDSEKARNKAEKLRATFRSERKDAIDNLRAQASKVERKRAAAPATAFRDDVLKAGGAVVSAQPPKHRNFAYSHIAKTTVGTGTLSTPSSQREAARFAVSSAEAVAITWARGGISSSAIVGSAIETGKGMIAVSVPEAKAFSAQGRIQEMLTSDTPGRAVAEAFPDMDAKAKLILAGPALADGRICGETGLGAEALKAAAGRISARLDPSARMLQPEAPAEAGDYENAWKALQAPAVVSRDEAIKAAGPDEQDARNAAALKKKLERVID